MPQHDRQTEANLEVLQDDGVPVVQYVRQGYVRYLEAKTVNLDEDRTQRLTNSSVKIDTCRDLWRSIGYCWRFDGESGRW